MLVLCGGALLIGATASVALRFVPFATALIVAIGCGAAWAARGGLTPTQMLLSALALLVSTQVGYGLGLVASAAVDGLRSSARRRPGAKPASSTLPDLHLGEKP